MRQRPRIYYTESQKAGAVRRAFLELTQRHQKVQEQAASLAQLDQTHMVTTEPGARLMRVRGARSVVGCNLQTAVDHQYNLDRVSPLGPTA